MHRQHIYEYIELYCKENGYTPSLREITEHVGISLGTVSRHLHILAALGQVEWQPKVPYSVRICGSRQDCQ